MSTVLFSQKIGCILNGVHFNEENSQLTTPPHYHHNSTTQVTHLNPLQQKNVEKKLKLGVKKQPNLILRKKRWLQFTVLPLRKTSNHTMLITSTMSPKRRRSVNRALNVVQFILTEFHRARRHLLSVTRGITWTFTAPALSPRPAAPTNPSNRGRSRYASGPVTISTPPFSRRLS